MFFKEGHDSRAIANIFVGLSLHANRKLTTTQLVKLVYFAHGWTLGYTENPLIRDEVQAWRYGPVVPVVYYTFRPQGLLVHATAMDEKGQPYTTTVSDAEFKIISNVYKRYSPLSVFELTDITHNKETPWSKYNGKRYHTIKNEEIKCYYTKRVERLKPSNG